MTPEQLFDLREAALPDTGNRLVLAFKLTHRSQADCVRTMGFASSYVSDITCGRRAPSLNNARKFADYFGCYIEDLFPAAKVTV
jgi:transcriptional regulator with XRE-family HTH domain